MTLKAIGTSSTSKRGTQTWKVTGSSNVYLLNNVSGSKDYKTYQKYPAYADEYHYYYWSITTQSTSYTWTITGTSQNGNYSTGKLYNSSSTTKTTNELCTISSNTTYTYTGTLPYTYINIEYYVKYYTNKTGSRNDKYYKYFNPLTIYRTISTYGWG